MMRFKNAIVKYIEKYEKEIITVGAMLTGDYMGAVALQEMDR